MWGQFWTHFISEEAGYTERSGDLSKVMQLVGGEVGIQTQQSDFKSHEITISAKAAWEPAKLPAPSVMKGIVAAYTQSGLLCTHVPLILPAAAALLLLQPACVGMVSAPRGGCASA